MKHHYDYSSSNPISFIDPTGLFVAAPGTIPAPGESTVVCDGHGGVTPWIDPPRGTPLEDQRCMAHCATVHEQTHARDILAANPSVCVGQPFGTIIEVTPRERNESEYNAYSAEVTCLKNELAHNTSSNRDCCVPIWKRYLAFAREKRDLYDIVRPNHP